MHAFTPFRLWSLVLGIPLACGSAEGDLHDSASDDDATSGDFLNADPASAVTTVKASATPQAFPGAGTSGAAQPLAVSLAPETSDECDPAPTPSTPASSANVQTVCFYSADDAGVPAATIEQVVEVVGNSEWVHIRLTLNPDFVDNTYGSTSVGWGDAEGATADAPPPPPPPPAPGGPPADAGAPLPPADLPPAAADARNADAGAPPPPAARPPRERPAAPGGGGARPARGKPGGHTFRDLVGSDHAEIQLLDSNGALVVHFKLDYLSESEAAASGYASLGVSGGEGELIVGDPEWILASATSIDRNLNACGLSTFLEDSPPTDALYTPDPSASDWDYRVAYEVWVATEAFGSAGFASALIENVHASPSKADGNTVTVVPAPCPNDPASPEALPEPVPRVLEAIR
jgi:hypothetical protein